MSGRSIARVLLAVILIGAAIGLGVTAYNAGVSAGLSQNGTVAVAPGYPVGPYVGWGWGYGHGFGLFGMFGGLLFLFLLFALVRAAFGGGHRRGWNAPGPGWSGGWRGPDGRSWEDRARAVHDEWHRTHPDDPASTATPRSTPPARD